VSSCGSIERRLLDIVRDTASDGVRLEVEGHLEGCARCRESRAAFQLLGELRGQPPPRLGPAAERRIVARLVTTESSTRSRLGAAPRRRSRVALAAFAALAVGAGGLVAVWRLPPRLTGSPVFAEGQTLERSQPGVLAFGGADVRYDDGTVLTFHPTTRTLALTRGRVDVDVIEHSARRFRVTTGRFIVEVLGTRFVVTLSGVRTLRGRVEVLDLDGHELAYVSAGQSWSPPPADVAPAVTPLPVPEVAPAHLVSATPTAARAPVRRFVVSVADLLARARAALSEGDSDRSRTLMARARAAGPRASERPSLDLLAADVLLVERRPDEAIAAYRAVTRRYERTPEGETAAFAAGQLLSERGAEAAARAAFDDYLARYPRGRFAREADERIRQLHARE
jgi:hypothetical protein